MIIKEVISQAANARGINILINWVLNDNSVMRALLLLSEKFEYHDLITKQYQLLPALKELQLQVRIVGEKRKFLIKKDLQKNNNINI
jgi:hypothetical protein